MNPQMVADRRPPPPPPRPDPDLANKIHQALVQLDEAICQMERAGWRVTISDHHEHGTVALTRFVPTFRHYQARP